MHGPLKEGLAKPVQGKAGQEGGCMRSIPEQRSTASAERLSKVQKPKRQLQLGVGRSRRMDHSHAVGVGNDVTGGKSCRPRECRAVRALHGLAHSETVSMKKPPTGEPYAGKPHVRVCVQRRLACSAGGRPAGATVRSPVVRIAGWRETKILKPIDKISLGEITSHRAVTTVNVEVASKVSGSEGRARNRRVKAAWGAEI